MGGRFSVTYRVFAADEGEARARAQAVALEQTVEIPRDVVPAGYVEDEILGRVEQLSPEAPGRFRAAISYSPDSAGPDLAQLLNVIFGNSSIQTGLKVVGLDLGPDMAARFPGARFGARGLRELTGKTQGGLVCPVIKPMGLPGADLAETAYQVARAGADIVKEDHGLANQPTAPFRARVPAIAEAVARANARRRAEGDRSRALYFANLPRGGGDLRADAEFARRSGADGLLVIPGLHGFQAIFDLATDPGLEMPVMAHPSFLGPHVLSENTGFSHAMMFATLMRLAGADISIFPNFGGRFGFSRDECASIVEGCRCANGPGRPILPSPGGGMSIDRMGELRALYGEDCVYLLGGGLLRLGARIGDGVRDMVAALA